MNTSGLLLAQGCSELIIVVKGRKRSQEGGLRGNEREAVKKSEKFARVTLKAILPAIDGRNKVTVEAILYGRRVRD